MIGWLVFGVGLVMLLGWFGLAFVMLMVTLWRERHWAAFALLSVVPFFVVGYVLVLLKI